METKTPVVAGAGICCADYMVVSPQIRWGDSINVSDYYIQGGGLVGTAMVACARLGAQCNLLSILGDDSTGDGIVAELVAEGISSDGIQRVPGGKSPFSFIHVDEKNGERTIFHREASGLNFDPSRLSVGSISKWGALLVDSYYMDMSLVVAQAARKHGVPVVADLIPCNQNIELLKYIDVLIAPEHYAKEIRLEDDLDAALDSIHKLGPTTAIITLGPEGCVYSDSHGRGRGRAFAVDVVDTTGAGDTFHGAFTYALARGWSTGLCCEFSAAVAAIKCTMSGGRTGLPSLEQTLSFLKKECGNIEAFS